MTPVLQALFDLSLSTLGAIVGGGLLLSAATTPLWGRYAGRYGTNHSLSVSAIGGFIGILFLSGSIWMAQQEADNIGLWLHFLVLGRVIYCATANAALPLSQAALAANSAPQNLFGTLGTLNAMNGIGRLAGNALVGPLLALGTLMPVAIVLPIYIAALGKLIGTAGRTTPEHRTKTTPVHSGRVPIIALANAFGLQCGVGAAYILLGPILRDRLDLPPTHASSLAGMVLALALASAIGTQIFATRRFAERTHAAFLTGCVLVVAGLVTLSVGESIGVLLVSACLLASGAALGASANQAHQLGKAENSARPRLSTLIASAQLLGLAAGTSFFGLVGSYDLTTAALLAAALPLAFTAPALLKMFPPTSFLPIRRGSGE